MKTSYIFGGIAFLAVLILLIVTKPYTSFFTSPTAPDNSTDSTDTVSDTTSTTTPVEPEPMTDTRNGEWVIGSTAGDRDIKAYTFGSGDKEILLVAGVHGGYSWNTAALGYQLVDYLKEIESTLTNVKVTVVPVLNVDGLFAATGKTERFSAADVTSNTATQIASRFNAHTVDLNRNFDCEWKATGTWQDQQVSGGSAAFSEPEAQAIRGLVTKYEPDVAIVYYSSAGGVFASNCNNGVLPATSSLLNTYGTASGYKQYKEFNYYEITGDMVNWFAKMNIPAISVLLTDHTSTELTKNKAGLNAVIASFNN